MKKVFLFIVLIAACSCETERIIFKGPYHVRFTDAERTERESNSKVLKIEVHNAGPELKDDASIFYSIGGNAREGIDFVIVGTRGRATIEKGEYFGYIEVRLINNANNILRSQDLVLTLTRVNAGDSGNAASLEVGQGEGGIGRKFTLQILDDCILGGTYDGTRTALSVPTKNIRITSADCENYRLSNWDVDIFGAADPVPLVFFDNGDNTLEIEKQTVNVFFGFFDIDIIVEGNGSVNPITREIFLNLTFDDSGDIYDVTLTLRPE
jgi:hypothetical protein